MPLRVVGVVVAVGIYRNHVGDLLAEKGNELRVAGDGMGVTGTTDMVIQAHHPVGGGHHYVKIMRHQQHAAVVAIADVADDAIEIGLAGDVHSGKRLVEHQQVRVSQQRPGEQNSMQLTARNVRKRRIHDLRRTDVVEHLLQRGFVVVVVQI
jgi:hypothetical protein